MSESYIVIPFWTAACQSAFFEFVSNKISKKYIRTDQVYLKTKYFNIFRQLRFGLIASIKCSCAYIFNNKDIRQVDLFGINCGHSINERCISWSQYGFAGFRAVLRQSFIFGLKYSRFISFFQKFNVAMVLAGDEGYPDMSIALQLACKYDVKAYVIKGDTNITIFPFDLATLTAYPDSKSYLMVEILFPKKSFSLIISNYRNILDNRLQNIRSDLLYMRNKETPMSDDLERSYESRTRNLRDAIWIYQHDFFDSPGIYGVETLFKDHFTWFIETLNYCIGLNVKVIIKSHPNNRDKSLQALRHLEYIYRKSPNVIFIYDDLSLDFIGKLDPKCICSVYGSVIPEACYVGIPVVTCGPNPYESYHVSYRAHTFKEYFELLHKAYANNLLPLDPNNGPKSLALSKLSRTHLYFNLKNVSYEDITQELWDRLEFNEKYPSTRQERNYLNDHIAYRDHIKKIAFQLLTESNHDFSRLLV